MFKNLSEKKKGILCIICAAFFFSLMTVCIRLSGDLPTMQKAFFRNIVAAFVSAFMLIKSGDKLEINKNTIGDLFMRAACGTAGLICNFYAVDHLNISDANMLNKLSPFFAMLMSIVILKEKASKLEWATVFVAFFGALLVIKPGFSLQSGAAFIGLLGGLGAGIAYAFVRRLGKKGVRGTTIVLFFSVFSTIVTIPGFILNFTPMTAFQLFILIMAGVSASGGQFSITAAYTHAPAKDISVYDYTQVIFAAIWGFFLFDQVPDIFSFIGYAIIIAAAILKFEHGKKA